MKTDFTLSLIVLSWAAAITIIIIEVILICDLQFCASNIIDHFFCDFGPVLDLSTSDISIIVNFDFVCGVLLIYIPFICILISYICIAAVILKISSASGKKKAFSTCVSHLILVCTYYSSMIGAYMVPASEGLLQEKYRSLIFVMLAPFTNPIIYTLRNEDFKHAFIKLSKGRLKTIK